MKIIITNLQLKLIQENIESFYSNKPTPTQLPTIQPDKNFKVDPNYDSQKELSKLRAVPTYIHTPNIEIEKKFKENKIFDFNDFRNFLYSPEGIALTFLLDLSEIGVVAPVILFGILVLKDICDWIEFGEPNWIYLISDLICMSTAGFSSPIVGPLIKESKLTLKQIILKFPKLISKLQNSLEKILTLLQKVLTILKDFINKNFLNVKFMKEFLNKISLIETKIIQKMNLIKESIFVYAKYKTSSEIFTKFMDTKYGQDFSQFVIPIINPILGPDKIPQFLIDLAEKRPQEIITTYLS